MPGNTRARYPEPTMKRKKSRAATIFKTGNFSPFGNCPEVLNLKILAASHIGARMRKKMNEIVINEIQLSKSITARRYITSKNMKNPASQNTLNPSALQSCFETPSHAFRKHQTPLIYRYPHSILASPLLCSQQVILQNCISPQIE